MLASLPSPHMDVAPVCIAFSPATLLFVRHNINWSGFKQTTIKHQPQHTANMPHHKSTITTLSNAADQSKCRLFRLPAEIRNSIYELAFENEVVFVGTKIKKKPQARAKVQGILLACKQTYAETLQLHFSISTFQFDNKNRIMQWLRNIGLQHRILITQIEFYYMPPAT